MNNLKIVIANPVTKGDWMELLSGLLGLPNDGGLSIAAWALGLEPEDLQFLLWDAQNTITEESVYYYGDDRTRRLLRACQAHAKKGK